MAVLFVYFTMPCYLSSLIPCQNKIVQNRLAENTAFEECYRLLWMRPHTFATSIKTGTFIGWILSLNVSAVTGLTD